MLVDEWGIFKQASVWGQCQNEKKIKWKLGVRILSNTFMLKNERKKNTNKAEDEWRRLSKSEVNATTNKSCN